MKKHPSVRAGQRHFLLLATSFFATLAFGQQSCLTPIYNRGTPKQAFVTEVTNWAKTAPDSVFTTNANADIYTLVKPKLAPKGWRGLAHRKAAMLEALIVLGGYESSWDWSEGIDVTNPSSSKCPNTEAGIFQTSANSMAFNVSLKTLTASACGAIDCKTFQRCTKSNHSFAIGYTALLLRYTTRHHGPLIRKGDVYAHLRLQCMLDLEKLL